jgi:hypothetical protein
MRSKNKSLIKEIWKAIVITIVVFVLNTTWLAIFGRNVYSAMGPPLFEEFFRFISILFFVRVYMYTVTLASIEFFVYIYEIDRRYGEISIELLIMRIICVFVHFVYFSIQYYGYKYKGEYGLLISFFIATLVHILWNSHVGMIVYKSLLF